MSRKRIFLQVIKNGIVKPILYLLLFLFIFTTTSILLLRTPVVQTYIVQKLSTWFSKQINHEVSIAHVDVSWYDKAQIEGIVIKDQQHNNLISIDLLEVDFDLQSLLSGNIVIIDEVAVYKPSVHLIWDSVSQELNINQFIWSIQELDTSDPNDTLPRKTTPFVINNASVQAGSFSYTDLRKIDEKMINEPKRFDHNFFGVDSINASVSRFYLHRDTIQLYASHLIGIETKTGLTVTDFNGFFRYTKNSLEFTELDVDVGKSKIKDQVILRYDHTGQLSYFVDSINVFGIMKGTVLHTHDIGVFAPPILKYNDYWKIDGVFNGKVNRFKANNLSIGFGKKSQINGKIGLDGLPDLKETFLDIDINKSTLHHDDLTQYVKNPEQIRVLKRFGDIRLNADFFGFPNDFVAHGDFETAAGKIFTDIKLVLNKDTIASYYRGKLQLQDFDLQKITLNNKLNKISLKGAIEGKGFTIDDANFVLDGNIKYFDYNNYRFKNITTDARFADAYFSGDIQINDTNLVFVSTGTINFQNNLNLFDIKSDLKHAALHKINLSDEPIDIKGELDLEFKGLELDEIVGRAVFKNMTVKYKGDTIKVSDFLFVSKKDSINRSFSVLSNLINFNATGNFEFKQVFSDLNELYREYELIFLHDPSLTKNYYAKKITERNRYDINYSLKIKRIQTLLNIFYPKLYISDNSKLDGNFSNGLTRIFNVSGQADSIRYDKWAFKDNFIELSSSKLADSANSLSMSYIESRKVYDIGYKKPIGENMTLDLVWDKDMINFSTFLKQYGRNNHIRISGDALLGNDFIEVSLGSSEIFLINNRWKIDQRNKIVIKNKEIDFYNLILANKDQRIMLDGKFSEDMNKTAHFQVENFELNNLEPLINFPIFGKLNGTLDTKDIYNNFWLNSHFTVNELTLDKVLYGDLGGNLKWNQYLKILDVQMALLKDKKRLLDLNGYYSPNAITNPIVATVTMQETSIHVLEAFLSEYASEIQGLATGDVQIKGDFNNLNFFGKAKVEKGGFTINYFNTHYQFEDEVYFNNDSIYVKNIALRDTLWNTTARVNGGITHKLFRDYNVFCDVILNNTFVLNTTEEHNDLFFGQAFGTGKINIHGPVASLQIKSDEVKSEKNTRIFIPLEGTESIGQKDYIRFVAKGSDDNNNKQSQTISRSNIDIDINFNVTEDANFEVIFDKKAGDIIRAAGNGLIQTKINTSGDFSVFGEYKITKGTYNFTLVNLINKAFKIDPNSTITWNGDPYDGRLNISALYTQNASIIPILAADSAFVSSHPDVKRRIPVTVYLYLKNRLMSPDITFGIKIRDYPNYPQVEQAVIDLESRIKFDEQLLNRQVFSLMVLKQLSPIDGFGGVNVGSASGNSVSELFSNQFSYWVSQFDENLEIDVDLSGFDDQSGNTFRLRMAYSILDGKIRITRDGNFSNVQNQNDLANVFGEWTIEYLITNDGKLRLKAYNRTNQNTISSALSNASATTLYGASLMHTESFDKLGELFRKNKNKKAMDDDERSNEVAPQQNEALKEEDE